MIKIISKSFNIIILKKAKKQCDVYGWKFILKQSSSKVIYLHL